VRLRGRSVSGVRTELDAPPWPSGGRGRRRRGWVAPVGSAQRSGSGSRGGMRIEGLALPDPAKSAIWEGSAARSRLRRARTGGNGGWAPPLLVLDRKPEDYRLPYTMTLTYGSMPQRPGSSVKILDQPRIAFEKLLVARSLESRPGADGEFPSLRDRVRLTAAMPHRAAGPSAGVVEDVFTVVILCDEGQAVLRRALLELAVQVGSGILNALLQVVHKLFPQHDPGVLGALALKGVRLYQGGSK
jgi:hypothetical protein